MHPDGPQALPSIGWRGDCSPSEPMRWAADSLHGQQRLTKDLQAKLQRLHVRGRQQTQILIRRGHRQTLSEPFQMESILSMISMWRGSSLLITATGHFSSASGITVWLVKASDCRHHMKV